MKKKDIVLNALAIVAAIVITLTATVNVGSSVSRGGIGYKWMAYLNDNLYLNQLSIPGSHDSGATYSIADLAGKCQSLSISSQINSGVRFFDMRVQLVNDELKVVHSFVDQKLKFASALEEMTSFVEENPTEFLIVSIKEDADPVSSSVSVAQAVKSALEKHPDQISLANTLPQKVADARGKIHIISRIKNTDYGVPMGSGWRDDASFELSGVYVQDNYEIDDVSEKQMDITLAIEQARGQAYSLVLNFTSCYLSDSFPPSYAATPAKTINPWIIEKMKTVYGSCGVVIMDFVTPALASSVYMRNF